MDFYVVIPARFGSARLPGKPLADIHGKPMIQWVYERAAESDARAVIVATDDQRIADAVHAFGGAVAMTDPAHASGTDRLQEVAAQREFHSDDIVVNVQGDEPLIPPAVINQVARNLATSDASVATLCEPISDAETLFNPNAVKVVWDAQNHAHYFSRAPIPWARDAFNRDRDTLPAGIDYYRHIGIYAYRVALLNRFVNWAQAPLEAVEQLEQLRVLWQGEPIHVAPAITAVPGGVDTEADLERVRAQLNREGL